MNMNMILCMIYYEMIKYNIGNNFKYYSTNKQIILIESCYAFFTKIRNNCNHYYNYIAL